MNVVYRSPFRSLCPITRHFKLKLSCSTHMTVVVLNRNFQNVTSQHSSADECGYSASCATKTLSALHAQRYCAVCSVARSSLQLNADVVASDAVNQLVKTFPEVEKKALPATALSTTLAQKRSSTARPSTSRRQALQLKRYSDVPCGQRRVDDTQWPPATIPALAATAADEANGAWRPAAEAADRER